MGRREAFHAGTMELAKPINTASRSPSATTTGDSQRL